MIININKPKNWTSFDVVAKTKGILKSKKVGHAGTLDPLAEGVLIILTDNDTKLQSRIMENDKQYIAEITFGCISPTYDLEYKPTLTKDIPSVSFIKENINLLLPDFIGDIDQKAPFYSAKKFKGKALYKYAREMESNQSLNKNNESKNLSNVDVKIPVKRIHIETITLIAIYEKEIECESGMYLLPTIKVDVVCSSGTYIRSLANDLGDRLGVGGVLTSLVRTRVGNYKVENCVSLSELENTKKLGNK